jgi:hypothetical protein
MSDKCDLRPKAKDRSSEAADDSFKILPFVILISKPLKYSGGFALWVTEVSTDCQLAIGVPR